MRITYYGHSTFGIVAGGKNLLFDPFISPNELAKDVTVDSIPADFIFISHGHEDHVADAVSIAKRTGATIVSNFEIVTWFGAQGVDNGHPMNHGGEWSFDFGTVKYVNAVHSSVLPDGTYGGNPGGFVVKSDGVSFYYAGDTALTYDMKLLGDYEDINFAFLPIGDNFTMGISDAVIAADFIKCDNIIAMHYDTFGYIVIDKDRAKKEFTDKGKQLSIINIGESIDL
ncbi:MAG TPA: metal-dependent hydrolase [Flavobacteriales bacterium]|nr:metal-dependent hydrolase [Flavobacteriales bacterium]HIA11469.1 metal-dependent hydrolase [Flavobacteriales bacterium]HIO71908.1 metal-dependent hydrolase [Flavobacteriales bacterium]